MVKDVLVVGGGSAGFLAAITLKARIPTLQMTIVRSREIGIIGVGEGSTGQLTRHLHGYLAIDYEEFYKLAKPLWKLGIRFLWGVRPFFDYSFGLQFMLQFSRLSKPNGYYVNFDGAPLEYAGVGSALMSHDKAFARGRDGNPIFGADVAYHIENEHFVQFLEKYARRLGIEIVDDTITEVLPAESGISGVRVGSGNILSADLYVDCSGFRSLILSQTLKEPLVSFKTTLFCDRAVVGGWQRTTEPIKPYTTAETMESGWCWQIEHENRINRGYVYSSPFISDEEAEREFRSKNPKVDATRIVKFTSGRYERSWVGNVVAIGNASGFVEPLESTSLGFICSESAWLAESLLSADMEFRPVLVRLFNQRVGKGWDNIRQFLAVHYKFNTRLNNKFWRACRSDTQLCGSEDAVECYEENGPNPVWGRDVIDAFDQFSMEGYLALLVGQQVPHRSPFIPSQQERQLWEELRNRNKQIALQGVEVRQAIEMVKAGKFPWPTELFPRICRPAPPLAREAM